MTVSLVDLFIWILVYFAIGTGHLWYYWPKVVDGIEKTMNSGLPPDARRFVFLGACLGAVAFWPAKLFFCLLDLFRGRDS